MTRTPHSRPGDVTGTLRAVVVGATATTLAVAAHGLAGGGYPGSAALTLLLITAAGVGTFASLFPISAGKSSRAALLAILAIGQLGGHLAISVSGGHHTMAMGRESAGAASTFVTALDLPTGSMLVAHAVATLVCAALIVAAERLYIVVSQAIRTITSRSRPVAPPPGPTRWPGSAPRTYRLLRAGALGSRAPPAPA